MFADDTTIFKEKSNKLFKMAWTRGDELKEKSKKQKNY